MFHVLTTWPPQIAKTSACCIVLESRATFRNLALLGAATRAQNKQSCFCIKYQMSSCTACTMIAAWGKISWDLGFADISSALTSPNWLKVARAPRNAEHKESRWPLFGNGPFAAPANQSLRACCCLGQLAATAKCCWLWFHSWQMTQMRCQRKFDLMILFCSFAGHAWQVSCSFLQISTCQCQNS